MYVSFTVPFAGMVPRLTPKQLAHNQAVTAQNCDLKRGDLRPVAAMNQIEEISSPADPISIYKHNGSWLAWATDVDVVKSVINSTDTIYYTGDGEPKVRRGATTRTLGINPPKTALTITIQDKGSGNSANVDDSPSYVYTYVSDWGEESAPSPATPVTDLYNDKKFQLSGIVASSQTHVTRVRIYRLSTTSTGFGQYQFLTEQPDSTSTFNDYDGSGEQLDLQADVLQTEGWTPPSECSTNTGSAIAEDDCSDDDTGDWTTNGSVAFDTDHYEFTANDSGDVLRLTASLASNLTNNVIYRACFEVKDGTKTGASVTFGMLSAGQSANHTVTVTTSSTWQEHSVTFASDADDVYLGMIANADWDANIEIRNISLYQVIPLSGLCEYSNGMLAGFSGNIVYFCEPFIPYAWPSAYSLTFDSDIVGIKPFNEMLIVVTGTKAYVVTGNDPEALSQDLLPGNYGCVSKRSLLATPSGVVYASNDGMVFTDGATGVNLTEKLYTKSQWAECSPSTMISFWYDDQVYIFNSGSSTGRTLDESGVSTVDITDNVYGGYVLPDDNKLYLITLNEGSYYVDAFMDAATYLTYTYQTKTLQLSKPTKFSVGRVFGDFTQGNLTLKIYNASTLWHTATISSDGFFRLPEGYLSELSIKLEGKPTIESIEIAQSPKEMSV